MTLPRQTIASAALAMSTLALGVYLGTKTANQDVLRVFYILALVALAKGIFTWGDARGFPIRSADGTLQLPHLVRNLVMTLLAAPIVILFSVPLAMLAFQLAR